MKKLKFITLSLALATSVLTGCNTNKEGPGKNVISKYTYDNTDYSTMEDAEVTTVRFYYHRNDNTDGTYSCYQNYRVYIWDPINGGAGKFYDFDKYNSYGVFKDIVLDEKFPNVDVTRLGFLITTESWNKDVSEDRFVDISEVDHGGVQTLYLRTGDAKIFDNPKTAMKSNIKYARLVNDNQISLIINAFEKKTKMVTKNISVKVNGEPIKISVEDKSTTKAVQAMITLPNPINIRDIYEVSYKFDSEWTDTVNLLYTTYFDSESFKNNYGYEGNDLGVSFNDVENVTLTTFKVWAPTSKKMVLRIYNTGDYLNDRTPTQEVEMTIGEKGVWSAAINGDLSGKYYTYVVTNSAGTNEVVDPYAKSAGVNGRRGMVVNFHQLNKTITGWNEDVRPDYGNNPVDGSIYEMHVRDMTINPNSGVSTNNRGKFLGLTEEGTTHEKDGVTVKTGLDHLKELGITHVQILPFYDYSSVDESLDNKNMSDENYNWGYDPQNYNVLEGSYSTNPNDGLVRIREFKQMVMALHKAGIGINMDVVYNHTSSYSNSNFELLVPYYYHRTQTNGTPFNGSGCGNEMASNRFMCRKFIVDSIKFWLDEYHLSGFRFDLMGLLDNQTMIDIYKASKAIYDKVMVYGEPWCGGTTQLAGTFDANKLDTQRTEKTSINQPYFAGSGNYVGAFNDVIRNALRGDNNPTEGYVQAGLSASSIVAGMKGTINAGEVNVSPEQVINYVSCHDNYTLYDQLIQTNKRNRAFNVMYTQADAVVFTSQGVPFMQEGEDFLRSKDYIDKDNKKVYSHNSYNVGDNINDMDYDLKVDNLDVFNNFKALINARKNTPELRLASRNDINEKVTASSSGTDLKMEIRGLNGNGDVLVLHSFNGQQVTLDGEYEVIYYNADISRIGDTVSGTLSIPANGSYVLRHK